VPCAASRSSMQLHASVRSRNSRRLYDKLGVRSKTIMYILFFEEKKRLKKNTNTHTTWFSKLTSARLLIIVSRNSRRCAGSCPRFLRNRMSAESPNFFVCVCVFFVFLDCTTKHVEVFCVCVCVCLWSRFLFFAAVFDRKPKTKLTRKLQNKKNRSTLKKTPSSDLFFFNLIFTALHLRRARQK